MTGGRTVKRTDYGNLRFSSTGGVRSVRFTVAVNPTMRRGINSKYVPRLIDMRVTVTDQRLMERHSALRHHICFVEEKKMLCKLCFYLEECW